MICEKISFREKNHWIKVIENEEELIKAYRLRHSVFCETLKWVPVNQLGMEIDRYDAEAVHIGVFSEGGELVGLARVLFSNQPYMLETEFSTLVGSSYVLRKDPETVEISRLTITSSVSQQGLSSEYICFLLKGIYQWCFVNQVRYVYLVIEKKFWRVLTYLGFSCVPIGQETALPPGQVKAMAVIVDLELFRNQTQKKKKEFVHWMSIAQSTPAPMQEQLHARELKLQVL
ncbi:MAG: GNAT family N-acetyltransferase [Nitrospirae bacterium]|nr:GNAT family N-acetyltransferase [Nitrospirota bacterium]